MSKVVASGAANTGFMSMALNLGLQHLGAGI